MIPEVVTSALFATSSLDSHKLATGASNSRELSRISTLKFVILNVAHARVYQYLSRKQQVGPSMTQQKHTDYNTLMAQERILPVLYSQSQEFVAGDLLIVQNFCAWLYPLVTHEIEC